MTTATGEPLAASGQDNLSRMAAWSLECSPDWRWSNVEIFETQDPNWFWVECDGEGKILFDDYEPGHYKNQFISSTLSGLNGGKITCLSLRFSDKGLGWDRAARSYLAYKARAHWAAPLNCHQRQAPGIGQ